MALKDTDLKELWDSFDKLHVEIDARRRTLASMSQQTPLSPEEEHLLDSLGIHLDQMDAKLNNANVQIKDYVPPVQPTPAPEATCYCGKARSVCVAENGAHCHHPDAAAHMWGD